MQRNTPVVPCMKSPLPERKEHGTPRPHTPRQVRVTCTPANRVCRLYKNSMVQVRRICRSPATQAGHAQHEIPRLSGPIRSVART